MYAYYFEIIIFQTKETFFMSNFWQDKQIRCLLLNISENQQS